jgi:hypothetical protein
MVRDDLINEVLARMDELQPFSSTLVVTGGNALSKPAEAYARKTLEEAANDVLKLAPVRYIQSSQFGTIAHTSGVITPATDFLRFVQITYVKDSKTTQISELHPAGSQAHLQQKFDSTAASALKPIAVVRADGSIEVFPAAATSASMKYVKKVAAIGNTNTICTDDLLPAIAWQAAGKALAIMGDARASTAFELAKAIINA